MFTSLINRQRSEHDYDQVLRLLELSTGVQAGASSGNENKFFDDELSGDDEMSDEEMIAMLSPRGERRASGDVLGSDDSVTTTSTATDDDDCVPELLSKGAKFHALGTCNPCSYLSKPTGCSKGADCLFCHICNSRACVRRKQKQSLRAKRRQENNDRATQRRHVNELRRLVLLGPMV